VVYESLDVLTTVTDKTFPGVEIVIAVFQIWTTPILKHSKAR
jgi:hypothetical protein